ncbi:carbohydrate ABC transporter permease [Paenibacillus sedimenti]|uniref:Carbohydrate ABC transporter permease n=1 Tax=Paenibacillus sedimenti TaxID=2770274 RepID=A0A926KPL6_9BACL|nr:carbohydrate ABC transporter permease [Paenibacillus sedimenti]MBD0380836.1 carbohydrate ABC transporter permease [Paenibacillus sedimenti]
MRRHKTVPGVVFDGLNYTVLALFACFSLLPFLYVVAGSFASDAELTARPFFLIPQSFTLSGYEYILSSPPLFRSLAVSMGITLVGTLVNLAFTVTMAYPLARRELMGRNTFLNMIVFTMVFSGGLIPTYLVVKELGLIDSYWALIIPGAINAFNLIVVKNFFQELPPGLEESAKIDGCNEVAILWKIVLPLSKPVLATFALFYAVGHWNNFFSALLYINDAEKWPLQVLLRQIVMLSQGAGDMSQLDPSFIKPPEQTIKMAVIVLGTLPILLVYPFVQKYFAKGVLIGSIKG